MKKIIIIFFTVISFIIFGLYVFSISGQSGYITEKINLPQSVDNREKGYSLHSKKKTGRTADIGSEENNDQYVSKYGPLPGYLAGIDLDGELAVDSDGQLVLSESIKQRFDFFLSTVSDEGLETCIGRIEENIMKTLPPEASDKALDILTAYINYKKSIYDLYKKKPELPATGEDFTKIKSILENRNKIRRKHFDADVVAAFFEEQEAYDNIGLRRLEIHYDKSIGDVEKQAKYKELEKEMPDMMRERYERERKLNKS